MIGFSINSLLSIYCRIVSYLIIEMMLVVCTVGSPRKLVNILVVTGCYVVGNSVFIYYIVVEFILDVVLDVVVFNDGVLITVVLLLLVILVIVDVMSVINPFEPITNDSLFFPFGQISDNIPVVLNPFTSSIILYPIILYLSLFKWLTPSTLNLMILPICLSFSDVGITVNDWNKLVSGKVKLDKYSELTPVW